MSIAVAISDGRKLNNYYKEKKKEKKTRDSDGFASSRICLCFVDNDGGSDFLLPTFRAP